MADAPTMGSLMAADTIMGRLSAIEQGLERLSARVERLSGRLGPVEDRIRKEEEAARTAEIRQAARAELADELGIPLVAGTAAGSGPDPKPSPKQRDGWIWDAAELAGTTGGRRVIGAVVTIWATGWLGPEAGRVAELLLAPRAAVMQESAPEATVLPGLGPQKPAPDGDARGMPAAPRPTL